VNLIKNFQWENWRFISNSWDKWRTRNNCKLSCFDLFFYSHIQVALGWESWRKGSLHIKVKVIPRHYEIWQFRFSVKDNKREIEREAISAMILRPTYFGCIACVTPLKYCGINFLRKELCVQTKGVFYGHQVRLHTFIFGNFICVQNYSMFVQIYRKHEADFYMAHRKRSIINYLSLFLNFFN